MSRAFTVASLGAVIPIYIIRVTDGHVGLRTRRYLRHGCQFTVTRRSDSGTVFDMGDAEVWAPVDVEDGLYKLEHHLRMLNGVVDVRQSRPVPRELHVLVALSPYDWDVREDAITLVDDFAREHIGEISVVVDFADAAELSGARTAQ